MGALTHNLNIEQTSWHSRWYHYWLSLGGNAPGTENLCHYVRVLVFWAPAAWFFRGRIFKVIPPWTIVAAAAVIGAVTTLCVLWPNDVLRVLIGAAAVIAVVAFVIGLALGVIYIIEDGPRWARIVLACVTFPIWIVPMALVFPVVLLIEKHEKALEAFKNWWTRPRHWLAGISPVTALLAVIAIAVLATVAIFDFKTFLGLVIGAVVLLIAIVLAGLLVILLDEAKERHHAGKPVFGEKFASVSETVKLGATYVATKKRGSKICPFIHFDDQPGVSLGKDT